jgi:hypothetical protein
MSRINRFLPPFTGEVARTKCATMGAARVEVRKNRSTPSSSWPRLSGILPTTADPI